MATQYLPIIREEDYEAFRRLLGQNLPGAYDDWNYLSGDRQHQIARSGHIARGIELHPDEFTMWLSARREDATLNALDNFAFHKGSAVERD
jgi:gluconate kinase